MQADLHRTVRETYGQAISEHRAQREAFDLATQLLRASQAASQPHVKPAEARRLVAKSCARAACVARQREKSVGLIQVEFPR